MNDNRVQQMQSLSDRTPGLLQPETQKVVLMLQSSQYQGEIWRSVLMSQGVVVIWETGNQNPMDLLNQMQADQIKLPDALLIEISNLTSNPYDFCRWCRVHCPKVKVVLTNARQKEISPPEHHWATYQGAQDLLPGFRPEILLTQVPLAISRFLSLLEWPLLRQDSLLAALAPFMKTAMNPPAQSLGQSLKPLSQLPLRRDLPLPSPVENRDRPPLEAPPQTAPPLDKDMKPKPKRTYRGVSY
ncbi:MAG: hypothetical protein SFW36_20135 [Leptolyngbyaceae cyanobacterium bins.59]|nr:hypothetical protein [Leptolyngbyaceae cyanobacterium bins.59]